MPSASPLTEIINWVEYCAGRHLRRVCSNISPMGCSIYLSGRHLCRSRRGNGRLVAAADPAARGITRSRAFRTWPGAFA